MRKLC